MQSPYCLRLISVPAPCQVRISSVYIDTEQVRSGYSAGKELLGY